MRGGPPGAPRERLPDDTSVEGVRLQVGDLERSLAFYREVLGLGVLRRGGSEAALGVEPGPALVELVERPGARPAAAARLGLFHFALLLPDRAALGRFAAHLAGRGIRPGGSDHLVSEALYLSDPDGLGIEVYADRPRREWRHQGGQVAMATLPLDLAELARAGGGAPWDGAPEGTVMGHVHLHVGDVARAAEFYAGALGLEPVAWDHPGALFLSAGGYHHHLGINAWAGPRALPAAADEPRLLEWRLRVPRVEDAEAAARRLENAGAELRREADARVTADPWGTVLRIQPG